MEKSKTPTGKEYIAQCDNEVKPLDQRVKDNRRGPIRKNVKNKDACQAVFEYA
jgi:hypothetical protein